MYKFVLIFNFINTMTPTPYTCPSHHVQWVRGYLREGMVRRESMSQWQKTKGQLTLSKKCQKCREHSPFHLLPSRFLFPVQTLNTDYGRVQERITFLDLPVSYGTQAVTIHIRLTSRPFLRSFSHFICKQFNCEHKLLRSTVMVSVDYQLVRSQNDLRDKPPGTSLRDYLDDVNPLPCL